MKDEKLIEKFLASYQEEVLTKELQVKALKAALNSGKTTLIRTITPAWKRLSLAASIAAFAIGIIMSNQVFTDSQTSDSDYWNFGETGLYSYVIAGE
jgi:molybdopterin-guanine dinucleotide biosynthesis protein